MADTNAWLALVRMAGEKIVAFLPRWIVKGFYPLQALQAHIHVDVRSVDFRLGDVPHVYLWLIITNCSPYVDIKVDQIFVDIWDSQPLVKVSSSQRPTIRRCTKPKEGIPCEADLTDGHVRRLRERKGTSLELKFYVHAFFETAIGPLEWRETITVGDQVRVAG
jgi:hypothetical protein